MLIEKEDIQKAKEKLGDRNAELIVEILGVQDYDEKNRKAPCPFHEEDHASWIYNPKKYCFHCFGACSDNTDIIDAYLHTGVDYVTACKNLFELADMPYAFGEYGVKTRAQYRYPKEVISFDNSKVYEYLGKRGISQETVDYCDVRQDEYGNCVFNYYDTNGVLTMVKYRPSHKVEAGKPKMWFQKDTDNANILFNMNRVNPNQPLLIVEGECFKGDVQVLTPGGWVRLDEYGGQDVLQVKENGEADFVTPLAYINKEYCGRMHTVKQGKDYVLTTTENHNWVYVDNDVLQKKKICEFSDGLEIPLVSYMNGSGIELSDDEIQFYIRLVARSSIEILNNEDYNYAVIDARDSLWFRELADTLGYEFITPDNGDKYVRKIKIPKMYQDKEIPFEWVCKASMEQRLLIMLDMYMLWRNENFDCVMDNIHNAEVLQAISHTCGYLATIKDCSTDDKKLYTIFIEPEKKCITYKKELDNIEEYSGKVYCVSVSSGMILVRQNGCIFVCGNCDCLAAIESGYKNTVSVSNGAGTFLWIEACWDFLEQFDSIIIASDNDAAGLKMQKECIYRLGSWRTKVMEIPEFHESEDGKRVPVSDINEMMYWFGKQAVLEAIVNAKDTPVPSVESFGAINEISIYDMDGIETGFKELDKEIIKLFYGTLTILSGRPGSGKSSLINQWMAESIDNCVPVFLYSQEMMNQMLSNWFNLNAAGARHIETRETADGKQYYLVNHEAKEKIKAWANDYMYIYKDDSPNDIDSIMKTAEDCVRKYGCKTIILDNLMMIDLKCNDENKNEAQTSFVNRLISFAKKFNIAIILVAHPKKTPDMTADVNMYDISGSSNIINLAMRSIGLRRVSKREKEDPKSEFGKHNVVLTVMKDRMLGKADLQIGLFYDIKSRRFFTDYEEYAKQFSWDNMEYEHLLPIPDCLIDKADEEVFGEPG